MQNQPPNTKPGRTQRLYGRLNRLTLGALADRLQFRKLQLNSHHPANTTTRHNTVTPPRDPALLLPVTSLAAKPESNRSAYQTRTSSLSSPRTKHSSHPVENRPRNLARAHVTDVQDTSEKWRKNTLTTLEKLNTTALDVRHSGGT